MGLGNMLSKLFGRSKSMPHRERSHVQANPKMERQSGKTMAEYAHQLNARSVGQQSPAQYVPMSTPAMAASKRSERGFRGQHAQDRQAGQSMEDYKRQLIQLHGLQTPAAQYQMPAQMVPMSQPAQKSITMNPATAPSSLRNLWSRKGN